jgi:OOP family OmpA-OmpF porin
LLVALLIVVVGGVAYGLHRFDGDLTARSQIALRDAGIPVKVHFDGRHGYLTGSLEYEEDVIRAVGVVNAVRGVADVTPEISFTLAGGRVAAQPQIEVPPSTNPELTLRIQDGAIQLNGRVGTPGAHAALVTAAADVFGGDRVVDRMRVVEGIESASWVERIPTVIPALSALSGATVAFGVEGASVAGTVDDPTISEAVAGALALVVAPLPVNNRIAVVVPEPARLEVSVAQDVIVAQGAVPDGSFADEVVAVVADMADGTDIVNELAVGPGVIAEEWMNSVSELLMAAERLDVWSFEIGDGRLVVSGLAASDVERNAVVRALEDAGTGLAVDTSGLEVAPDAVAETLTALLRNSAVFVPGEVTLSGEATVLLDEAVAILLANPSTFLMVEGHTDDQGPEGFNLQLSEERADAVVEYLIAGGVDADRLTAIGRGESSPVADNATSAGRAENRRIEFVVEKES